MMVFVLATIGGTHTHTHTHTHTASKNDQIAIVSFLDFRPGGRQGSIKTEKGQHCFKQIMTPMNYVVPQMMSELLVKEKKQLYTARTAWSRLCGPCIAAIAGD